MDLKKKLFQLTIASYSKICEYERVEHAYNHHHNVSEGYKQELQYEMADIMEQVAVCDAEILRVLDTLDNATLAEQYRLHINSGEITFRRSDSLTAAFHEVILRRLDAAKALVDTGATDDRDVLQQCLILFDIFPSDADYLVQTHDLLQRGRNLAVMLADHSRLGRDSWLHRIDSLLLTDIARASHT